MIKKENIMKTVNVTIKNKENNNKIIIKKNNGNGR